MISTKGLQVGQPPLKLSTKILLRQKSSTGGSALRIRVAVSAFAMLTRAGARTLPARTLAMGLRRACVYDP